LPLRAAGPDEVVESCVEEQAAVAISDSASHGFILPRAYGPECRHLAAGAAPPRATPVPTRHVAGLPPGPVRAPSSRPRFGNDVQSIKTGAVLADGSDMTVLASAHRGWSWPGLWRAGSIAVMLGAVTLAWWAWLDFGVMVGYALDGSKVWPTWTPRMVLGISVVALITVGLFGSSGLLLRQRREHPQASSAVRIVVLASMAWTIVWSWGVVQVDKMWAGFTQDQYPEIWASRTIAWRIHLGLGALWLLCAALWLAASGSWLFLSSRRSGD